MTTFPAHIDDSISLPKAIDGITPVDANSVNRLRDAIIAIENSLGANPGGIYSCVARRLEAIENLLNYLLAQGGISGGGGSLVGPAGGDLAGYYPDPLIAKLCGVPLSCNIPATNDVLAYDGYNWTPSNITGLIGAILDGDVTGQLNANTIIKISGDSLSTVEVNASTFNANFGLAFNVTGPLVFDTTGNTIFSVGGNTKLRATSTKLDASYTGLRYKTTRITGTYTISQNDHILAVDSSVASIVLNLPTSNILGDYYVVKDIGGNSSINIIYIDPTPYTIDGLSTPFEVNRDWAALTLIWTGTEWSIV